MAQENLVENVRKAIDSIDPAAEVILYGSRARQEATELSDWDFLVLTPGKPDSILKRKIRDSLYELEWDTGKVICVTIKGRQEWKNLHQTPFYKNVEKDGLRL